MSETRNKRWLFASISVLGAYLCIELFSWGLYSAVNRSWFGFAKLKRQLHTVAAATGDKSDLGSGRIKEDDDHISPYLGYNTPTGIQFFDPASPEQTDPNGFVVAITGGSVANRLFLDTSPWFSQLISRAPSLKGKHVYVVNLAQETYHQPQQINSVLLYLTMGGRLDMLVLLDGFNEVAHPWSNYKQGVFPLYPWRWAQRKVGLMSRKEREQIGKLALVQSVRAGLVRFFGPLSFSLTAGALWSSVDKVLAGKMAKYHFKLQRIGEKRLSRPDAERSGPQLKIGSQEEVQRYGVSAWKRASVLLEELMRSRGARFFHFLQPNQYVVGSKRFTKDEERIAIGHLREEVRQGYHLLRPAGSELARQGQPFFDLTMIYTGVAEPVYVDDCCHVNSYGNLVMAENIASQILHHSSMASTVTSSN
jgi:hypothetical protein